MAQDLHIFTENIEPEALSQIYTLLDQAAFRNAKVRIMPDVHAGKGCVIGFTADLGEKVIPNIVGVDIGCGVHVVKFPRETNINLEGLDHFIKQNIPSGFEVNTKVQMNFDLTQLYCYSQLIKPERLALGLGSLGGGNHFIELDKDEEGYIYLVIHTGSRNLGKQVACIYQDKAIHFSRTKASREADQKIIELKAAGRQIEIADAIAAIYAQYKDYSVPKDLCFLEGQDRMDYLHDMKLCQDYAVLNRQNIANRIVQYIGVKPIDEFESVHNYIDNQNIVRKGAIAAHLGQKVIIPLNMRDGAIIGIGKGNIEWNESAPHGAGRLMSRGEARQTLSLDEFKQAMVGIYTSTVNLSTIDEAPMAYKDASEIINAIGDTVEITQLLKPIYNFKAAE